MRKELITMKNEIVNDNTSKRVQCVLRNEDAAERYLLLTPEQIKLFKYLKECDVIYDCVDLEVYNAGIDWETL